MLVLSHALTSLDFNSQPHKEADLSRASLQSVILISTHSLTRRLTSRYLTGGGTVHISTHSLTRRLTESDNLLPKLEIFQLTASQGG